MTRRSRLVAWLLALGIPLVALAVLMRFARVGIFGRQLVGLAMLVVLALAGFAVWRHADAIAERIEPRRLDRASLLLAIGGYASMGLLLLPLEPHLAMVAQLIPAGLTFAGLAAAAASIAIRRGTSGLNLCALVLNLLFWVTLAGMSYMYSGF